MYQSYNPALIVARKFPGTLHKIALESFLIAGWPTNIVAGFIDDFRA